MIVILRIKSDGTTQAIYSDSLYASSAGSAKLILLTPFTAGVTANINYTDIATDSYLGTYSTYRLVSQEYVSSFYPFTAQGQDTGAGLAYVHEIPAPILSKDGTLRLSIRFVDARGIAVATGYYDLVVLPNNFVGEGDEPIADNYLPVAALEQLGITRPDGVDITIDSTGTLSFVHKPVYVDLEQTFTVGEKEQARANIEAVSQSAYNTKTQD